MALAPGAGRYDLVLGVTVNELRPKRELDNLTPSARKNKELLDAVPRTAMLNTPKDSRRVYLTGSTCGRCFHFSLCSRMQDKNANEEQNYCAAPSRGFKAKEEM